MRVIEDMTPPEVATFATSLGISTPLEPTLALALDGRERVEKGQGRVGLGRGGHIERRLGQVKAALGQADAVYASCTEFLKENKKWWLAPIVIAILGLGLLVLLGGTAAAPFIYTLF